MSRLTKVFSQLFSAKSKPDCLLAEWNKHCVIRFHSIFTSKETDALIQVIKDNNDINDIKKLRAIETAISNTNPQGWLAKRSAVSKRTVLVNQFLRFIKSKIQILELESNLKESIIPSKPPLTVSRDNSNKPILVTVTTANRLFQEPELLDRPLAMERVITNDKEELMRKYERCQEDYKNRFRFMPKIRKHEDIKTADQSQRFEFYKVLDTIRSNISYVLTSLRNKSEKDPLALNDKSLEQLMNYTNQLHKDQCGHDLSDMLTKQKNSGARRYRAMMLRFNSYLLMPFTSFLVDLDGLFESLYTLSSCVLF